MPNINETNTALLELQQELEKLKNAATLLGETREAASNTIHAAKQVAEIAARLNNSVTELAERTNDLVKRIESIDFPSRFDKLDATVSAVNVGIQNTLSRLESLERNLTDRIHSSHKEILTQTETKILESRNAVNQRLTTVGDSIQRQITINRYFVVSSTLLLLVILVLQLLGK